MSAAPALRKSRAAAEKKAFSFDRKQLPSVGAFASKRSQAFEVFQSLPIPDTSVEAWRRTDLKSLPASRLELLSGSGSLATASPLQASDIAAGVLFTSLRALPASRAEAASELLNSIVHPEEGKFAALASAFAEDGVVLLVPAGVAIKEPLRSGFIGAAAGSASASRMLIVLEQGASATLLHEFSSATDLSDGLHAGLTEVIVKKGAKLNLVQHQAWGRNVWNITHERVRVDEGGELDWIIAAVGSKVTKSFAHVDLVGPEAKARISGFYFADGSQHLDHDTEQNHLAPRTTSDLLFKGALTGASRSVWHGMIRVARDAQKADGYQANRNILLDPRCKADSIPGLEILADDVRCTHGATVSRLDSEPMFYLQSRGLGQADAARLLVKGFFDPILKRVPLDAVRSRLSAEISAKMGFAAESGEELEES